MEISLRWELGNGSSSISALWGIPAYENGVIINGIVRHYLGCPWIKLTFNSHIFIQQVKRTVVISNGVAILVLVVVSTTACLYISTLSPHDDVIKWRHFPRNWPFVRGIHWSPVNSPHKGQWRGALMFSLICAWINDWVNNGRAGDLRRYCSHCDVTVMYSRPTN